MTTKQAVTIVNGMKQGLNNKELAEAVNAALVAAKMLVNDKNVADVTNEYRQHQWDVEDLTGPADNLLVKSAEANAEFIKNATNMNAKIVCDKKPAAKKATKKVAKPAAKKPAAKKEPRGKSRVARMFELVLAGHTNEGALAVIVKEFGRGENGKITNASSIGWCRSQLKAKSDYAKKHNPKGLKVLTNAEAAAKGGK